MIIAFEGIDGSGKGTQSIKLSEYLTNKGVDNILISFPNYTGTFFGKEIAKYLNGGYGAMADLPAEFPAMLYAIDRYEMKDKILSSLSKNKVVIFDRYVPSNFAHQAAKLDANKRQPFIKWVKTFEYDILGLPKADNIYFLDVPPSISSNLVLHKDKRSYTDDKKDIHEKDNSYLEKVYNVYKEIAIKDKWHIINCVNNGLLLSVDDIFSAIINTIEL